MRRFRRRRRCLFLDLEPRVLGLMGIEFFGLSTMVAVARLDEEVE